MNFFLLILVYARKKEWRTFQRKFLLFLLIELFPITITYTKSVVKSLWFIYYYMLLLFTEHLLCVRDQSNNNGKSIHNTFSHGIYSVI